MTEIERQLRILRRRVQVLEKAIKQLHPAVADQLAAAMDAAAVLPLRTRTTSGVRVRVISPGGEG